jgi:hypothetical protein
VRVVDVYRARVAGQWRRVVAVDDIRHAWPLPIRVQAKDGREWIVAAVETIALPNQTGLCLEGSGALPEIGTELEIV